MPQVLAGKDTNLQDGLCNIKHSIIHNFQNRIPRKVISHLNLSIYEGKKYEELSGGEQRILFIIDTF